MQNQPAIFEEHEIRRVYNEATETWWFSVVHIIQVLAQQAEYQAARKYLKVLKNRLIKEGSESVTVCNRLKLPAADGKSYLTDVATAATLLQHGRSEKWIQQRMTWQKATSNNRSGC